MQRFSATRGLCVLGLLTICAPALMTAQSTMLRVIGSDSVPIPYAWISVEGGAANIADERGETSLGGGRHQTLTVEVRRIGYAPWFGKLEVPDSAAVLTVTLPRIAQKLAKMQVTGEVAWAPNEEVDERLWISPSVAATLLSYETDRDLLRTLG